ncbi:MAG: DUF885 family protein [Gemmatimonadaceae bacterium]
MTVKLARGVPLAFMGMLALVPICPAQSTPGGRRSARYADLVTFFNDWRTFQQPKLVDGVPDYSASAMTAQHAALAKYQHRLAAIDTTGWSVPEQVDYHIVRAEMNGLDFSYRVLRPWARNPAFYVSFFPSRSDQPAREGTVPAGAIELWTWQFPLTPQRAAELTARLRTIPKFLQEARGNLNGNGRDLWIYGIRSVRQQSADLAALSTRVAGTNAAVDSAAQQARQATDLFRVWLEQQTPSKTGLSGIGIANYNWYLKNVQLVPYTWAEEEVLMRRELARSRAALKLEEDRDRNLPPLVPISTAGAYTRGFDSAVTEYIAFLRNHHVLTVRDYMNPALRARAGAFSPPDQPREFFNEVSYRDPIVMLTHDYHWFDLARMTADPHPDPIRRGPLLYNIFVTRTEGFATAMEEMMMHEGFLDGRPRSSELIYVLIAERAARALGDLHLQSNDFTMEQAKKFASDWTPRGWLRVDGNTVSEEQHLYLQQPAYGTSYIIGKTQFDQLLDERAKQLGNAYTTQRFMDEFNAAGLIPMSLIRWELTGNSDEIIRMTSDVAHRAQ